MTNHSAEFYVVQRHTIHTDVADNDALMEVIDEVTQGGDSVRTTVHEKDVPLRFIADGGEDEDGPFMTAFPTDHDPWTPRALRELAQWCLTRANEKDGQSPSSRGPTMSDHLDRAAEVLRTSKVFRASAAFGVPDEAWVDAATRMVEVLDAAGLLASPGRDAAVYVRELRADADAAEAAGVKAMPISWLRERADRIEREGSASDG